MKRLNNKGFTLVELLAVVVILALVMGIAASSMLNTMNSSRISTLHSAAQTAATNLNNWVAEDMLAILATDQKLGTVFIEDTQDTNKDDWICLETGNIVNVINKGDQATLLEVLGISKDDIVIGTTVPGQDGSYTITKDTTCSALRYNSTIGGYEFFLNAKKDGKYFVASAADNFAFSRAEAANTKISD